MVVNISMHVSKSPVDFIFNAGEISTTTARKREYYYHMQVKYTLHV